MKAETVVSGAVALGSSVAAGTLAGLPIISLGGGFGGGVFVVTASKRALTVLQVGATLLASTLVGGFLGPLAGAIADAWLRQKLPGFELSQFYMHGAAAFAMGAVSQVLWHAVIKRLTRVIGGEHGEHGAE